MAGSKPRLSVILSPGAKEDLLEIWHYNAKKYGVAHAESYWQFLHLGIYSLATEYEHGKRVEGAPELKFVTSKRGKRGDGHVLI